MILLVTVMGVLSVIVALLLSIALSIVLTVVSKIGYASLTKAAYIVTYGGLAFYPVSYWTWLRQADVDGPTGFAAYLGFFAALTICFLTVCFVLLASFEVNHKKTRFTRRPMKGQV
jgi:hypothetical protein